MRPPQLVCRATNSCRRSAGSSAELLLESKIRLNQIEQREPRHQSRQRHDGAWVRSSRCSATMDITEIMVNGPGQVYVERGGKLELTDVDLPRSTRI